ncbi:MAG: Ig-like domain repeat protein [Micrococcales bacterium]|nr:Ig-like domain repeat protein [Micrococcales bacterium]
MVTKKGRRASVAVLLASALAATSLITMTQASAAPVADDAASAVANGAAAINPQWTYDSRPAVGSQDPVTAEPLPDRPSTTPCEVTLFNDMKFVAFDGAPPQDFDYAGPPAACPGPWAKVVMVNEVWTDPEAGLYDKTVRVFLGGVTLFYGTTQGPGRYEQNFPQHPEYWNNGAGGPGFVARNFEEIDVTEYSPLFMTAQPGVAHYDNDAFSSGQYLAAYPMPSTVMQAALHGTSKLLFYPLAAGQAAPVVADKVMSLEPNTREGYVIWSNTQSLSYTFNAPGAQTLPRNLERLYLDFHREGQRSDEFYNGGSGRAALREFVVKIDGVAAGVAPAYPYKYTYSNGGGYNNYHWAPVPAVSGFNFIPYRVDLTPFAGVLADGAPHTVSIDGAGLMANSATSRTCLFSQVRTLRSIPTNQDSLYCKPGETGWVLTNGAFFYITGTLVAYTDKGTTQTTGAVTQNTLTATPTVTVRSNPTSALLRHDNVISGYVEGSKGKVTTTLDQKISLDTNFTASTTAVTGANVNQLTKYELTTTVTDDANTSVRKVNLEYIDQGRSKRTDGLSTNGWTYDLQTAVNGVQDYWVKMSDLYQTPTAALGSGLNNPPQTGTATQRFVSFDSTDKCYDRLFNMDITQRKPSMTGITDDVACDARVAPSAKLAVSPARAQVAGAPVAMTATLDKPAATGSVQFFDGPELLATAAVAAGAASFTTSALAAGLHPLKAVYVPDLAAAGVFKSSGPSNTVSFAVGTVPPVDEDLEVDLSNGVLSLEVPVNPAIDFGSVQVTGADQFVEKSSNTAVVADGRGTDEGWTLTGVASDFVGDNTGRRILAANLGWLPWSQLKPGTSDGLIPDLPPGTQSVVSGPVVAPANPDGLSTPKVLCHGPVGSSTGQFECGASLKLGIPWSTPADHYTAVLTLTLI